MTRPRRRGSSKKRRRSHARRSPRASSHAPTLPDKAPSHPYREADVLRTARSEPTPARVGPRSCGQWRILACASLCGGGAALGLTSALAEAAAQAVSTAHGLAFAIAAICAGLVLGLWMPRRIIHTRLSREHAGDLKSNSKHPIVATDIKLEFAASLFGGLAAGFALILIALIGMASMMEAWRASLVHGFVHPQWLTRGLLFTPLLALLVAYGAVGTTVLTSLHGWHRLAMGRETRISLLWACMLLGVLAGGVLMAAESWTTSPAWGAPLAVFIAAIIAVARNPDAACRAPERLAYRRLDFAETLLLVAAAVAAAATAAALFASLPRTWPRVQDLAFETLVVAGGALAGLLGARLILRLGASPAIGVPLLLVVASALVVPYGTFLPPSMNVGLLRLAIVALVSAACIVILSRSIARSQRSIQSALSWIGRFVASGFGLAVLAVLMSGVSPASQAALSASAIGVAVCAGLILLLDTRRRPGTRIAGLAAAALCIPLIANVPPHVSQPEASASAGAYARVESLLRLRARAALLAGPFRVASVSPREIREFAPSARDVDLSGPRDDFVVIHAFDDPRRPSSFERRAALRLLRRLRSRLVPGGRLVVELPAPPALQAALADLATCEADTRCCRVLVRDGSERYEALIFGADTPLLVARMFRTSALQVSLEPIR